MTRYRHTCSPLVIAIVLVAFGIYGVVFFRLRQTLEWLKARITYPRTGYAASPYFTSGQEGQPVTDLTMLNLSKVEKPGILPSGAGGRAGGSGLFAPQSGGAEPGATAAQGPYRKILLCSKPSAALGITGFLTGYSTLSLAQVVFSSRLPSKSTRSGAL
ncbi:MAG: hypothetical protein WBD73_12190 [Candidatus Acidiferrales bacterium]